MRRRPGTVPAVTRGGILVLILFLAGPACSRDRASVHTDPAPSTPLERLHPGPIHVPDLFSLTRLQAVTQLEGAGLTPVVRTELAVNFKLTGMHCRVIAQRPLPGAQLAVGTPVHITVYMPVGTCE